MKVAKIGIEKKSRIRQCLVTFAVLGAASAWSQPQSWMEPCECQASLREAIPEIYANRLDPDQQTHFIDLERHLIEDFVASREIPNSQKLILWSVYEFGLYDIANALIRAHRSGIEVRVITDGKSVTENPSDNNHSSDNARNTLTQDVYRILTEAGIPVSYSDPEWAPFASLMHEKVRIFARKSSKDSVPVPLFAYLSTHNDTYSETLGDPRSDLSPERLRQGNLGPEELVEGSRGNVQQSFILRHGALLRSLVKNFLDQERHYGQGRGRISGLPQQAPSQFNLQDGSVIRIFFTYGQKTRGYNPNSAKAAFFEELDQPGGPRAKHIRIKQFVFSFDPVENALKALMDRSEAELIVSVDGKMGLTNWSKARTIGGLYSVFTRAQDPIELPWSVEQAQRADVRYFRSRFDKLHSKTTLVTYESAKGELRHRIFTGSLNLSANGVSNKEVFFEIDTQDERLPVLLASQDEAMKAHGELEVLAHAALFNRLMGSAFQCGYRRPVDGETKAAFQTFLQSLGLEAWGSLDILTRGLSSGSNRFLDSVGRFYRSSRHHSSGPCVVAELADQIKKLPQWETRVDSAELALTLVDDKSTMKPHTSEAILKALKNSF